MGNKTIYFFPDYSRGNPYQRLLYETVDCLGYHVIPGSISKAINSTESPSNIIFHVHWLNALFFKCTSKKEAWNCVDELITGINFLQTNGGKVIWTIHNHVPHENLFPEQDLRVRNFLSMCADRLHLHCASHFNELNYLPIDFSKIFIQRHGSYLGYYGDFSIQSRITQFDINHPRALFLGTLRDYKSLDILFDLIENLVREGIDVTVAGNPESETPKAEIEARLTKLGANFLLRRLTEAEVHNFCLNSDIGILSYNRILTSGTLKLYLSYGLQILAPNLQTIKIEDRYNTFVYYNSKNFKNTFKYEKLTNNEYNNVFFMSYALAQEATWSSKLFLNL